jgi:hypothetical protein
MFSPRRSLGVLLRRLIVAFRHPVAVARKKVAPSSCLIKIFFFYGGARGAMIIVHKQKKQETRKYMHGSWPLTPPDFCGGPEAVSLCDFFDDPQMEKNPHQAFQVPALTGTLRYVFSTDQQLLSFGLALLTCDSRI